MTGSYQQVRLIALPMDMNHVPDAGLISWPAVNASVATRGVRQAESGGVFVGWRKFDRIRDEAGNEALTDGWHAGNNKRKLDTQTGALLREIAAGIRMRPDPELAIPTQRHDPDADRKLLKEIQ